jgi:hypothetical protein
VTKYPPPALLGPHDRQCLEQAAEEPARESQAGAPEIWMADTRKDALAAFDAFVDTWGAKYDKAVESRIVSAARHLRLPRRALEASANAPRHRKLVPAGYDPNQLSQLY